MVFTRADLEGVLPPVKKVKFRAISPKKSRYFRMLTKQFGVFFVSGSFGQRLKSVRGYPFIRKRLLYGSHDPREVFVALDDV